MIVDAVYSRLSSDAGVSAIAGASVFPVTIPQGASKPAIVYTLDGDEVDQLLDGLGEGRLAFVAIDCYADLHAQAHSLADAVEACLSGYRGAMGAKTVEFAKLERRFDLFETETKLYRVSLQFRLAYH